MKLKNRKPQILMLLLALCILSSCMKYEDVKFVGIENVKVGKVGMNETTMEMNLIFNNPNSLGATLNNAEGKAWIEDIYVGNFLLNNDVQIPAKSNFSVPVHLAVNVKDVINNSLNLLFKDSVNLKVDGTARLSKAGILKAFPLKYQGKKSSAELLQGLK